MSKTGYKHVFVSHGAYLFVDRDRKWHRVVRVEDGEPAMLRLLSCCAQRVACALPWDRCVDRMTAVGRFEMEARSYRCARCSTQRARLRHGNRHAISTDRELRQPKSSELERRLDSHMR